MHNIKVGQIWKERDNRFHREVEVVEYIDNGLPRNVKIKNLKNNRCTWASDVRFDGKSMNYVLVKDVV